MAELQATALTQEQLLQFQIVNNTNFPIPNIPFLTPNVTFNSTIQYQYTLPANLNIPTIITPVVTTLLTPALQTVIPIDVSTGTQLTYQQITSSISTNNYATNFFYAQSVNCNQVGQVFTYNDSDIQGNGTVTALPFTLDPYQKQCAVYYYPPENLVSFNGTSSVNFTMLPDTTLNLKVFSSSTSPSQILDEITGYKDNAFTEIDIAMGSDVFNDYCNYLIDNE
ncbi:hypothetical protein CCP3SC1AL1_240012 [Gammaproteobacteria bacterium]